jgi:geranylgeranyl reductase family protein
MGNYSFDLAIIGGGPAGSAAAIAAAKIGLNTIILERQSFPRDKICGDAFMNESFQLLEEYGYDFTSLSELKYTTQNKEFKIEDNKGEIFKLPFPNVFQCKRNDMDDFLWKSIPESVQKREGVEIESMNLNHPNDLLINYYLNGEKESISCRYIIGADGYSSLVKRTFFPGLKFKSRIACRYYTTSTIKKSNALEFFFYPEISPGYFWIFPLGENEFNTGVYLPNDSTLNVKKIHETYFKRHFQEDINENNFHVWPIPNNIQLDILATDKILLTGDAAGLCDSMIGHGIDSAILTGVMAVKSIGYFEKDNCGKYNLNEIYSYHLKKTILPKILNLSKELHDEYSNEQISFHELIIKFISRI